MADDSDFLSGIWLFVYLVYEIREDAKLSYQKRLYPNRQKPIAYFYSTIVFKEFDKHYSKR